MSRGQRSPPQLRTEIKEFAPPKGTQHDSRTAGLSLRPCCLVSVSSRLVHRPVPPDQSLCRPPAAFERHPNPAPFRPI